MRTRSAHPKSRAVATVLAVTVLATLLAVGLAGTWSDLSRQRDAVAAERAGVAYLRPLTDLIGVLAAAGSTAVRGGQLDTGGISAAAAAVAHADAAYGAGLGSGARWAELRQRIGTLIDAPGSGETAYQLFGDVLGLAVQLTVQVGDASGLVVDPGLDAHHLMDAGLRLPAVMVDTARTADLVALPLGADTAGDRAAAVAVARREVAAAATRIGAGLKDSVRGTGRAALGTDLVARQDEFQNAVDALTPPSAEPGLSEAAARVTGTAAALAGAIWSQLDRLLAQRLAGLADRQRLVVGGAACVLACAVLLLWLLAPDRRVRATDDDAEDSDVDEPEAPQITLITARDLLGAEELVHVGRAVLVRPRERDGAE